MACVHLTWSLQRSPVIQALSGSLVARSSRSSDRCLLHWRSPRSALGRFLGRLYSTYSLALPWCRCPGRLFFLFSAGGHRQISTVTRFQAHPSGFCTGYETLALVRPMVPYSLALSSKCARPVVSPAPSANWCSNPSFLQGCCPSSQALLSFTNSK